jgi:hypothetical protein
MTGAYYGIYFAPSHINPVEFTRSAGAYTAASVSEFLEMVLS